MGGGELASETIISYFRRGVIPVLPDPMVLLFRDCMTNKLVGIICFFVGNIEALHPIIFHLIHCYLNIPFHPRKLACTHTPLLTTFCYLNTESKSILLRHYIVFCNAT
jgi:hypothetical protein